MSTSRSRVPQPRRLDHVNLVRATFNSASVYFDDPALFFWEHVGQRTVEQAGLHTGDAVLDVCCGSGGSALPAGKAVGPTGQVIAVDIAENLLKRLKAKAELAGLAHLRAVQGELENLCIATASVDVALCIFGLNYARSIPAGLQELWRVVRPGGKLIVGTWGARVFEPAHSIYLQEAAAESRGLAIPEGALSWERINSPAKLAQSFVSAQLPQPRVREERLVRATTPDDFWTVVIGSGYRLLLSTMSYASARRVRIRVRRRMEAGEASSLTSDVLYAIATKSGSARTKPERRDLCV